MLPNSELSSPAIAFPRLNSLGLIEAIAPRTMPTNETTFPRLNSLGLIEATRRLPDYATASFLFPRLNSLGLIEAEAFAQEVADASVVSEAQQPRPH